MLRGIGKIRIARETWLSAGVAALGMWALIWYLCTPAVFDWASGKIEGGPSYGSSNWEALAYWLRSWIHEPGYDMFINGPVDTVLSRIVLVALLTGAGVGWAVRAIPPTARRWPWTLLAGWWLSVGAVMVATALVALTRPSDDLNFGGRADQVAFSTGVGAPVLAAFALVATGVAIAVGRLGRETPADDERADDEPAGGKPAAEAALPDPAGGDEPGGDAPQTEAPAPAPLTARASYWVAGAAALLPALVIAGLGNAPVTQAWVFPDEGDPVLPWGVARWLQPGTWALGENIAVYPFETSPLSIAFRIAQVLLTAGLFWLVLRQLRRRSLPGLVLTGGWTAMLAAVLTQAVLLPVTPSDGATGMTVLDIVGQSFWYAPGALTIGLLGGLVAWAVQRWWERRPAPADPGPPAARYGGPPSGPDGGPDDELVITVSR
jgi:hypothetical protein